MAIPNQCTLPSLLNSSQIHDISVIQEKGMIGMKSTVSSRGQVSIPARLRRKYGIEPEAQVEWIEEGSALKLLPLPANPVKAFRGAGRGRYTSKRLVQDRRKERLKEDARDRRT